MPKVQATVTDDLLAQIDEAMKMYAFSSRSELLKFCVHVGLGLLASRNRRQREEREY